MKTIFGLAIYIILIIFVAKVAKEKNRDVAAWVLLEIFFPILALILLAIMPKKENIPLKANIISKLDIDKMLKVCPECAEEIKLKAKVCRFCGHKFSDDEIEESIKSFEGQNKLNGIDYCFKCIELNHQTGKCKKTWFNIIELKSNNKLSNPCDFTYFKEKHV